jgi:hypothetical protein
LVDHPHEERFQDCRLVLYLDSSSPRSATTVSQLEDLCREHLGPGHSIEIVDLQVDPASFEEERIVVTPTLDFFFGNSQKHRFVGGLRQYKVFIQAVGMGRVASQMNQEAQQMQDSAARIRREISEDKES